MNYSRPLVPEDRSPARQRRSLVRALTRVVLKSSPSSRISPERFCANTWPDDVEALRIAKAASAPIDTAGTAAIQLSAVGVFRSLAPASAAMKLFEAGFSVDLQGLSSVRIPSVTAALPNVVFIAEGAAAPAIDLAFSSNGVGPVKKMAVLAAVSEELETAGPELASQVVGRVLGDATAKALDVVAFGSQAADEITPAGLLNNATAVVAAAGQSAMGDDLGSLAAAIAGANIDTSDLIYVASPRLATIVRVNASPKCDNLVLSSLAMPDKSIAAFAPAAILSGFGDLPEIETSKSATLNFAVPAGEIVDADGVAGRPVFDLFQQAMIGIRLRGYAAWTCVQGGAALISVTNW